MVWCGRTILFVYLMFLGQTRPNSFYSLVCLGWFGWVFNICVIVFSVFVGDVDGNGDKSLLTRLQTIVNYSTTSTVSSERLLPLDVERAGISFVVGMVHAWIGAFGTLVSGLEWTPLLGKGVSLLV